MVDGVNHGKLLSKLGVTTTKLNTRVSNKEIAEDRRFDLQLFLLTVVICGGVACRRCGFSLVAGR